ncbi:MAG: MFS transporter small subunit [Janthinobacterium lividum]
MNPQSPNPNAPDSSSGGSAVIAWLFVGLPLAWGVSQTFLKALALFK